MISGVSRKLRGILEEMVIKERNTCGEMSRDRTFSSTERMPRGIWRSDDEESEERHLEDEVDMEDLLILRRGANRFQLLAEENFTTNRITEAEDVSTPSVEQEVKSKRLSKELTETLRELKNRKFPMMKIAEVMRKQQEMLKSDDLAGYKTGFSHIIRLS